MVYYYLQLLSFYQLSKNYGLNVRGNRGSCMVISGYQTAATAIGTGYIITYNFFSEISPYSFYSLVSFW